MTNPNLGNLTCDKTNPVHPELPLDSAHGLVMFTWC
jgi:hypothetical protein